MREACDKCGGRGHLTVLLGNGSGTFEKVCPDCHGTGGYDAAPVAAPGRADEPPYGAYGPPPLPAAGQPAEAGRGWWREALIVVAVLGLVVRLADAMRQRPAAEPPINPQAAVAVVEAMKNNPEVALYAGQDKLAAADRRLDGIEQFIHDTAKLYKDHLAGDKLGDWPGRAEHHRSVVRVTEQCCEEVRQLADLRAAGPPAAVAQRADECFARARRLLALLDRFSDIGRP